MRPFGVNVSILEPGNFIAGIFNEMDFFMILTMTGTNIFNETFVKSQAELMWSKMDSEVQNVYTKSYFDKKVEVMRSYMNK